MMRITRTIHADATPERVIEFFLDPSINPKGMTMEVVYESPEVVGNSYEWTFKMLGIPRKGITVCTEYIPGERVAFRNFGALVGSTTWTVEPDDGGSKATVVGEMGLPVPLIGRLFDPFIEKQWEKNLEWGKREIEKQPKAEKTPA